MSGRVFNVFIASPTRDSHTGIRTPSAPATGISHAPGPSSSKSAQSGTPAPLSEQNYRRLQPVNPRHRWLVNRVSAARMVPELAQHLPKALCTLTRDGAAVQLTRLPECPADVPAGYGALLQLLERFGRLRLQPVRWGGGPGQVIEWGPDAVRIQGRRGTAQDVLALARIMSSEQRCVVTVEPHEAGDVDGSTTAVRAYVGRAQGKATLLQLESAQPGRGWADDPTGAVDVSTAVIRDVERVLSAPEARFRFVSVDLEVQGDGNWTVTDLSALPAYPAQGFTENARTFLNKRIAKQRARWKRAAAVQDALTPTSAERRLAQRHGFDVETIRRFGIDRENAHKFVSERDYRRAQPFNRDVGAAGGHPVGGPPTESTALQHALYSVEKSDARQGSGLRISDLSDPGRRHGANIAEVLATVQRSGEALLGPAGWGGTPTWSITVPQPEAGQESLAVTVNGIGYSQDEFQRLLGALTRQGPQILTAAGVGDDARPGRFSTVGSVQIKVSMLNPTGTDPRVADAYVVGHHPRSTRKVFRKEGQLVGTEQPSASGGTDQDSLHESLAAHLAAAESAGLDLWPEGLRDLASVDLVARISPRTGRTERARAMVGTELYEYTRHPITYAPLHGEIRGWQGLVEDLQRLCLRSPGLRFVEFTAVITTHGHRILGGSLSPAYPTCYTFSVPAVDFIRAEVRARRRA